MVTNREQHCKVIGFCSRNIFSSLDHVTDSMHPQQKNQSPLVHTVCVFNFQLVKLDLLLPEHEHIDSWPKVFKLLSLALTSLLYKHIELGSSGQQDKRGCTCCSLQDQEVNRKLCSQLSIYQWQHVCHLSF